MPQYVVPSPCASPLAYGPPPGDPEGAGLIVLR
jgi:hypothetical protein